MVKVQVKAPDAISYHILQLRKQDFQTNRSVLYKDRLGSKMSEIISLLTKTTLI